MLEHELYTITHMEHKLIRIIANSTFTLCICECMAIHSLMLVITRLLQLC